MMTKYLLQFLFLLNSILLYIVSVKNICVQLWDTAGEERYRALASAYYRGAVGVLLVFDVTNARSFKNLSHWLSEVRSYTPNSCQVKRFLKCAQFCDLPKIR